MASQHGYGRETGMHDQTPTHRRWIRRIALGLAVTAIMAPTAPAIGASSTGSAVPYLPGCGPMFYGGAPDSVAGNGPATRYLSGCGPMFYGGAPRAVAVNGQSAAVLSGCSGSGRREPAAGALDRAGHRLARRRRWRRHRSGARAPRGRCCPRPQAEAKESRRRLTTADCDFFAPNLGSDSCLVPACTHTDQASSTGAGVLACALTGPPEARPRRAGDGPRTRRGHRNDDAVPTRTGHIGKTMKLASLVSAMRLREALGRFMLEIPLPSRRSPRWLIRVSGRATHCAVHLEVRESTRCGNSADPAEQTGGGICGTSGSRPDAPR